MVVGIFVGVRLRSGDKVFRVRIGSIKVAQRVDFGGVGCGRAWVISLLKFFIGNSFQFWKLPPGLCINNMDNVYYPIFLS